MMKSSCGWPGHALPNSAYRYNPYMHTFMSSSESQRTNAQTNHRLRNVHASFSSNEYDKFSWLPSKLSRAAWNDQPPSYHLPRWLLMTCHLSQLEYLVYVRYQRERERDIHVNDVIISAMLTLPKATRCRVHRCSSNCSIYYPHQ